MFASPHWQRLGLSEARYVMAWDALTDRAQAGDLDRYLHAAKSAEVKVLLTFSHSRVRSKRRRLPSVKAFQAQFIELRKRYPEVDLFSTWNEANHCSQPTCRRPDRVARYYNVMRRVCPRCTIVAAEVLDTNNMVKWVRRFSSVARVQPRVWGLHPYLDANRFGSRGTRRLLNIVRGQIWFTEAGGLVRRSVASHRIRFPQSVAHAARATKWVLALSRVSRRIARIYFYHWEAPTQSSPTWDSALFDKRGDPRASFFVLQSWLERYRFGRPPVG